MLAILYLAGMVYFGDRMCRYFYRFSSIQHRFATSFLVGLLLSSVITYLGSLAFAWTAQPLIFGNVIFLGALLLAAFKMPRHPSSSYHDSNYPRPEGKEKWDWLCLGLCFAFSCWLMLGTLSFPNGDFQFGFKSWSDFGANLSLSQSLALGHNFPTEHPFFPGEAIRYHFLFWFQAANLSFLGLNLVWSINLLSILSLIAVVILIMTFAELLFASRVVSRVAAGLFFLGSSSLSYIPFLYAQTSLIGAISSILNTTQFLNSGYPYRGEGWGALTVDIYANQRHLASGIGLLFVVLIFLVDLYQQKKSKENLINASTQHDEFSPTNNEIHPGDVEISQTDNGHNPETTDGLDFWSAIKPLLFSGFLIGLLPFWNSAVFVAAFVILGSLFLFFPYRHYLACLIGMAILVGLPQLLLLRSGNLVPSSYSLFTWGYTIADPTFLKVLQFLLWTFGFKWLLIVVALWFVSGAHRRLFLALSSLVPVVFLFQLSTDAFNNHKLLNVWDIFASIFAAYALWRIGKASVPRTILGGFLALAMSLGAIIDLFPIHNDYAMTVPYKNDRLTNWLFENTKPTDVFLTQTHLTHPILFTGRKIFLGSTLFAWTAGYQVGDRQAIYTQMFRERDRNELVYLLNRYKIAYVGIDDGLKGNSLIKNLNESVFQQNFEKVFVDTENHYANLTIYKVPAQ